MLLVWALLSQPSATILQSGLQQRLKGRSNDSCMPCLAWIFFFNFSVEDLYGPWLWSLQGQKDNRFMASPESNNPGMHFPSLLLVIYF